jgi:hypothetical protein
LYFSSTRKARYFFGKIPGRAGAESSVRKAGGHLTIWRIYLSFLFSKKTNFGYGKHVVVRSVPSKRVISLYYICELCPPWVCT